MSPVTYLVHDEMTTLSVKAIGFGILADVAGSKVLTSLTYMVVGGIYLSKGMSDPEAIDSVRASKSVKVVITVCGLAATALGAYIAARLADENKLGNAVSVGILAVLISACLMSITTLTKPDWFVISALLFPVPISIMVGKHVSKKRANQTLDTNGDSAAATSP